MAIIAVQTPTYAGLAFTTVTPSSPPGGDTFLNDGHVIFYVQNGSGGAIAVTIDAQGLAGLAYVDPVRTVNAGATMIFGPFPVEQFNDPDGLLKIVCGAFTNISVAAIGIRGQ